MTIYLSIKKICNANQKSELGFINYFDSENIWGITYNAY